jgi:ubiquinone/menaquinone biosynthesis C-methylase UbiE
MDEHEFAKSLLAHERREWQDPDKIVSKLGVEQGTRVADLACGPGFFVVPFVESVGSKGLVYAVDKSPIMLEYLRSSIMKSKVPPPVRIMERDVSETGIPTSSCDIVFFANILHDISDPVRFVSEVKRIAKQDAKIVDVDWRDVDNGFGAPLDVRLSEKRSKEILTENGLVFSHNIDAGPYHYGLVFRK